MTSKSKVAVRWCAAALVATVATTASASFHLMQIEQVIAGVNGNTAAQAIQLRMRSSFQNLVANGRMRVFNASGGNASLVQDLTTNVSNSAAGARVLICTSAFASMCNPPAVSDFVMTPIPATHLAAGSLTFESNLGTSIYWRLSWGGAAYTGPGTGTMDNDPNGNFNPPFGSAIPTSSLQSLRFPGAFGATSTDNLTDYSLSASPSVWTNNAGNSFTLVGPAQACCFPGGTCQDLAAPTCAAQGGTPQGAGTSCATTSCPQPPQACCFLSGNCQDLAPPACVAQGGTPQGAGTTCATTQCAQPTEACCFPSGICQDLAPLTCVTNGGTPQGPGTNCGSTNCPIPTQACCFLGGTCQDLAPATCVGQGGVPQGAGTSCATTSCPQPTQACCFGNGTCTDLAPALCAAQGGTPQGPGTLCASTVCTPTLACCLSNGSCQVMTAAQCIAQCGSLGAVGSTCALPTCCPGDLNGDGQVGLADVAVAIQNWGGTYGLCNIAQIIQRWNQACVP